MIFFRAPAAVSLGGHAVLKSPKDDIFARTTMMRVAAYWYRGSRRQCVTRG